MCRTQQPCPILGETPAQWNRFSLLPRPEWHSTSFKHFETAVLAAARGDIPAAQASLRLVQDRDLHEWCDEHGLWAGELRVATLGTKTMPKYSGLLDAKKDPPPSMVDAVFVRDGYRCRYCHTPVVSGELLKAVHALMGNDSFPRGSTNRSNSGILRCFTAVADHVVPHSRGGATNLENLVTACGPCNYAKTHYTLQQLGLQDPRLRPAPSGWTPLQGILAALREQASERG